MQTVREHNNPTQNLTAKCCIKNNKNDYAHVTHKSVKVLVDKRSGKEKYIMLF